MLLYGQDYVDVSVRRIASLHEAASHREICLHLVVAVLDRRKQAFVGSSQSRQQFRIPPICLGVARADHFQPSWVCDRYLVTAFLD
jgi:hypothetical protein